MEAAFVIAMFLIGVGIGTVILQTYRAGGGIPRFYQENFEPAVMMACGFGFKAPGRCGAAKLRPFLLVETDASSAPTSLPTGSDLERHLVTSTERPR